ncbi:MAG: histidine phosphatase family protein [Lachnospiraceae bacterium]
MNLYIIRHGETEWNKAGKVQGMSDISLNEKGIALAEVTRDGLKKDGVTFDRVYSSPLLRARQTTETILEGTTVTYQPDARIAEMSFGEYEGLTFAEINAKPEYQNFGNCFHNPALYHADRGAESFEQVKARVQNFFEEQIFPYRAKEENVLLVCHGAVSRMMILFMQQLPITEFWKVEQYNCCVNKIHFTETAMEFEYINKLYYEREATLSATDAAIRR